MEEIETHNLKDEFLKQVKSCKKIWEGRSIDKIKEWNLELGKQIRFFDEKRESYVDVEITDMKCYEDAGSAFDELGQDLLPGYTREGCIKLYKDLKITGKMVAIKMKIN
jgi:ASC-1-like (ASCH) protein